MFGRGEIVKAFRGLFQRIKGQMVQAVPECDEICEFNCCETECSLGSGKRARDVYSVSYVLQRKMEIHPARHPVNLTATSKSRQAGTPPIRESMERIWRLHSGNRTGFSRL